MLKVFLVEDEFVIRESIKRAVDWSAAGFELVGEAGDGERAFPQILMTEPDVVITDIRMPFMDGLELSRLVMKNRPATKILILSGYDDFSYAREAISIGVADYLLKPVSGAKLLEALKVIERQIRAEEENRNFKEIYEAEHAELLKLERQRFMRHLIDGKLSMTEAYEKAAELDLDLTAAYYSVVLIQVVTKKGQISDESDAVTDEVLSATSAILCLEQTVPYIGIYEHLEGTMGLLVMGDTKEELEERIQKEIAAAKDIADSANGLLMFAAIGEPVERIREIHQSYRSASRLFAKRFIQKQGAVFSYRDTEHAPTETVQEVEETFSLKGFDIGKVDRRIVSNFLRSASTDDVEDFSEQCWQGIGVRNLNSQLVRQYIVMDVYLSTASFLNAYGVKGDLIEETCAELVDPMKYGDADSMKEFLKELFVRAIDLRDRNAEDRYGTMIAEAKQYIERHFADNGISLGSVAEAVGVSPNHLSKVFSQGVGTTFVEFLTQMRMEKAKELLLSTQIANAEIGTAVGYSDPHYFYYIFKKTQNMTPKEFREAGRGYREA